MPRAGSDLFSDLQNQFTLKKKDFNTTPLGLDVDVAVSARTTVAGSFDFARSRARSEYRNYVDNQRLPIEQSSALRQENYSASVKFDLTPRGHEVSPHAWIPAAVTPFIGAGAGAMHYKFSQDGDFIRLSDFSVFTDSLNTSGWGPSAHVFGGVDVKMWRRVYFSGEARYVWSHAGVGQDYRGYNPIDLAGLKTTAGIRYLF
jgi:hypothetical protein